MIFEQQRKISGRKTFSSEKIWKREKFSGNFFRFCCSKIIFDQNFFYCCLDRFDARGPLYTCLVCVCFRPERLKPFTKAPTFYLFSTYCRYRYMSLKSCSITFLAARLFKGYMCLLSLDFGALRPYSD